jgi:hypothetical protein
MKSAIDELDTLAAIAARGQTHQEGLVETEPLPVADVCLPSASHDPAAIFKPLPRLDSAEKLDKELARMRRVTARYLANHAPELASARIRQVIRKADWRMDQDDTWTGVRLPHYGGPIGKATSWYRMEFSVTRTMRKSCAVFACFRAVDYKAHVFVNGAYVGSHEGFFAPFEFDITRHAQLGKNELLVRVENDAICHSNNTWNQDQEGDKIYAATGLGWDEPGLGWHHCPPGMGISQEVAIEARPSLHLHDLFVRPLPSGNEAEIWVEVWNSGNAKLPMHLEFAIHGRNFRAAAVKRRAPGDLQPAGPGVNYYKWRVSLKNPRMWSPETPWLYQLQVFCGNDTMERQFGLRTFELDESPGPDGRRGRFLLNGRAIRLRGANTMGHEQQCVLHGDLDQLRDDILLAKISRMNFLRLTQRPVEREVYEMCDRLGMMTQTDLPLFAYLRRNQFHEAVRQSAEMEKLIRSHPCNVLVSFINEPFPAFWGDQSHRHLTRPELERFFAAATIAVRLENPDRAIKPIDGDYEPPGPGLPDGHAYSGWYNGHGIGLGRLHKGYWQPVKPGWNYACGEFGAEGLEDESLMRRRYPKSWLPASPAEESTWTPARIGKCQTGGMYGLWIDRQTSIKNWVAASQAHQSWVIRLMAEAFRRDKRMISFAVHLFIDAFPAGWLKTLIDCERRPKAAFFVWRDALASLLPSLRLDRSAYFSGETLTADCWVCNDTHEIPVGARLRYQLEIAGEVVFAQSAPACIKALEPVFQGCLKLPVPEVSSRTKATLRLAVCDGRGKVIEETSVTLDLFPSALRKRPRGKALVVGKPAGPAARLAKEMGFAAGDGLFLIDDAAAFASRHKEILEAVKQGARAVFLELAPGELELAGSRLRFEACDMEPRQFVSRATGHRLVEGFEENDFRFWHDPALDRPSPLLHTLFFADDSWSPVLLTSQGGWGRSWEPALAAAEKPHGKGSLVVCQISLAGRLVNPVARIFAQAL